jgi:hypothetical protein
MRRITSAAAVLVALSLSLFGGMSAASAFAITPTGAVLGPVPAGAKTLGYTWQGQERYYYCGPGAVRMALSARISPPSQTTIGNWMGTDENGTDDTANTVSALNHFLGGGWYERKPVSDPPTQAQRDLLKYDLVFDVDRGYAIVANVVSGWRPPGYPGGTIYHYVAVVGYADDGNTAIIADPAGAGAGGSSWGNVPREYAISTYDLGTWIGVKAYAA